MKKVRDRLFMGNIADASMVFSSLNHEITYVLSLLSPNILSSYNLHFDPKETSSPNEEELNASSCVEGRYKNLKMSSHSTHLVCKPVSNCIAGQGARIVRKVFPWKDTLEQNILDDLEPCLDFIEKGRQDGAVLVHCLAGVSRSATVITAYLMKTERMTLEDALCSLRGLSETVCPNDGFLDQLKLFEEMGFTVDPGNSLYKKFRVEKLGEAYDRGEKIETSHFAADPASTSNSLAGPENCILQLNAHQPPEQRPFLYRCKKCRRIVASQTNVLVHDPGKGCVPFKNKRNGNRWPLFEEEKDPECTSIFVEPMQWMMTSVQEGAVIGKLLCPNCQARLGSFNWAGMQCSCGAWVNPAFQLHKSRMDLA